MVAKIYVATLCLKKTISKSSKYTNMHQNSYEEF